MYVPAQELSYLVYTADNVVGDVFWFRPILVPQDLNQGTRPNPGDEKRISPGSGFRISAFYCLALETDNQVMIVFQAQNDRIWRLVYDFANDIYVEEPAELFGGRLPALDFDGILRLLYVLGEDVVMRNDFGEVLTLITPSERDIRDFDTKFKFGVSVLRYAGSHFLTNDIALNMSATDANVVVVYDGETDIVNVTTSVDEIISGNDADLLNGAQVIPAASLPGGGIVGDAIFVEDAVGIALAGGLGLNGAPGITILVWSYGGPNLPRTSTIAWGPDAEGERVTNIHFPWSNSNIYWDCGNTGIGNYDRMNYAESAGNFQGSWAHWAFTKDIASGIMRVYRNASQRSFSSGKTKPLEDTAYFRPISAWDGWMAEMAVIPRELSSGEIAAARNRGLAGQRVDAALIPGLQYYWVMDEKPGPGFVDKSGNGADAGAGRGWLEQAEGFIANQDASFNIGAFTWTSEITLEARIAPGHQRRYFDVFSGATTLRLFPGGAIEFRFGSTVWRGYRRMDVGRRAHVAVSHVFGDGSGTFVTVDGEVVVGDWVQGNGTEVPALNGVLSCNGGPGDQVFQMRISDVARPLSYIRDHVGGRA